MTTEPTTTGLVERARTGDDDAFRALTDPHRRELHVHCYRMLGSLQDADDAMQDTLVAAWQRFATFEGRASVRTWLYRIATNRCLNVLRSRRRRPTVSLSDPGFELPEPNHTDEVFWLDPYPDALIDTGFAAPGPERTIEASEAISLGFVRMVQLLPARQRAVLVLREVLGYHAEEVADLLDASVDSVTSALKRARATLERQRGIRPDLHAHRLPASAADQRLLTQLTQAYERGDIDALVDLLHDDVLLAMPPMPQAYLGLEAAARFNREITFLDGRRYRMLATRANGQPAFAAYVDLGPGIEAPTIGLLVFAFADGKISEITRFEPSVFDRFELPMSLPTDE